MRVNEARLGLRRVSLPPAAAPGAGATLGLDARERVLVHLVLALFAEQLWGFLWSQRRTSESVSVGSKLGL